MGRPPGGAGAAQAVPPLLSPGRLGPFGAWALRHDDSWLFVGIYIGLAIGLSLFVSLFWLVVVGVFHLTLEPVRQAYYRRSRTNVFLHAWWEIKMDVALATPHEWGTVWATIVDELRPLGPGTAAP
jgi:hypothetical protein